ncbi:hypothetical protein FOL47_007681 [Perkinsus chesapeaki]|uniref:Reverse transcriptase domain-containing protein n=1 Tax=Perkinsus chesapeaki TaxID=330153 RepID=A0A7J6LIX7_PERCH|nr:hypothetical protein FOL47_007681 [Perkinsus chesapeaki]
MKKIATDWFHGLPEYMFSSDVDTHIKSICDGISMVKNRHRSVHSLKVNLDSPDWWGDRLKYLRRKVRSLQRLADRENTPTAWGAYRKARNDYNKQIRKTRSNWYYKQLSEEKDYGRILKKRSNPGKRGGSGSRFIPGNDVFEHHTPYQPLVDPVEKPTDDEMVQRVLSMIDEPLLEEVWSKLCRKRDSSPGADGIVYSDIKCAGPHLRLGLEKIFRHMVQLGHFPEHGKDLRMIFLWKGKGKSVAVNSFRPIGMSSCVTKYLEMLLCASDLINRYKKDGKIVVALSLDMRGAFNNARHAVISTTVEDMCGTPVIFNLVSNYLHRRKCFFNGKMRISMTFCGTPQGGVLSPCVYRIFHTKVMEIIEGCSSSTVMMYPVVYADDTIVIITGDSYESVLDAIGSLMDALAMLLPDLGLDISEEKSILLARDGQTVMISYGTVRNTGW